MAIQANCQQVIPGTTNDDGITSEEETQCRSHRDAILAFLAPIRRLPPEIMGEIFFEVLDGLYLQGQTKPGTSRPLTTLSLMRVCTRWRSIITGTPRLFTKLLLSPREDVEYSPFYIIPKWISWSGTLPLDITILPDRVSEKSTIIKTLSLISQGLFRCRSLYLEVSSIYWNFLLPEGSKTVAPHLTTLGIYHRQKSYQFPCGTLVAPNLKYITLFGDVCFPLQASNDLATNPVFTDNGHQVTLKGVARFLQQFPDIEEVSFYFLLAQLIHLSFPLMVLPKLRKLYLEDWTDAEEGPAMGYFMEALRTPQLKHLYIDGFPIRASPDSEAYQKIRDGFFSIFSSCSTVPPLKRLDIKFFKIPVDNLLPFFQNMPLLECLTLVNIGILSDTVIKALTPSEDSCLLPALRQIVFSCVLFESEDSGKYLVQMLGDRLQHLVRNGGSRFDVSILDVRSIGRENRDVLYSIVESYRPLLTLEFQLADHLDF